jgi:hypothetical protein
MLCSHRLTQDGGLKTATSELGTLLECFANRQSMNILFDVANALIDDANKAAELREWFKSLNAYVRKVRLRARIYLLSAICLTRSLFLLQILLQAGYVLEPECNDSGTTSAIRDASSTMASTKPILITCLTRLGIGSRRLGRIRRMCGSGRIGRGRRRICCLIVRGVDV